jgi:hypothetical protein
MHEKIFHRVFSVCGLGVSERAGTNPAKPFGAFHGLKPYITPVILCGGAGSRLWPMSRDSKPKQFHKLVNDKTLLTNTLERVDQKGEGLRYLPTRIVGGMALNRCWSSRAKPARRG